jgi:hypothetical protein
MGNAMKVPMMFTGKTETAARADSDNEGIETLLARIAWSLF